MEARTLKKGVGRGGMKYPRSWSTGWLRNWKTKGREIWNHYLNLQEGWIVAATSTECYKPFRNLKKLVNKLGESQGGEKGKKRHGGDTMEKTLRRWGYVNEQIELEKRRVKDKRQDREYEKRRGIQARLRFHESTCEDILENPMQVCF